MGFSNEFSDFGADEFGGDEFDSDFGGGDGDEVGQDLFVVRWAVVPVCVSDEFLGDLEARGEFFDAFEWERALEAWKERKYGGEGVLIIN
jgi:hypothetical protein